MTPLMLRQVWTVVEATQTNLILGLDDSSLVHWLLRQVGAHQPLDNQQTVAVSDYIHSKISLIRDLAQSRC